MLNQHLSGVQKRSSDWILVLFRVCWMCKWIICWHINHVNIIVLCQCWIYSLFCCPQVEKNDTAVKYLTHRQPFWLIKLAKYISTIIYFLWYLNAAIFNTNLMLRFDAWVFRMHIKSHLVHQKNLTMDVWDRCFRSFLWAIRPNILCQEI